MLLLGTRVDWTGVCGELGRIAVDLSSRREEDCRPGNTSVLAWRPEENQRNEGRTAAVDCTLRDWTHTHTHRKQKVRVHHVAAAAVKPL